MKKRVVIALASVTAMSGLTGCAMFNKGQLHYNRTTTVGQELVDLQTAKEKGALTDEEYEKVKKEILKGGPVSVEESCSKDQ